MNKALIFLLIAVHGLLGQSALAAVLPEDRADILYHAYDGGGAEIDGPSILVRKDFADKVSVYGNYYVDSVSSASIDVQATASPYSEERTQYSLGADYLHNKTIISAGYSNSSENDYEASTVSFGISQDFFGDLSNLSLGYSQGKDTVRRNGDDTFEDEAERRRYSISLSQILTPKLIMALTVESVIDEGFLNNPYRSVRFADPTNPIGYSYQSELYPRTRNSDALSLKAMYYLPYRASLKAEVRAFSDSWGITANSFELRYVHPWEEQGLTFEAKLRVYDQGQADFYSDLFSVRNETNFRARDKELSQFSDQSIGLGVSYEVKSKYLERFDKSTINLYWDFMRFEYDNFRDVTFRTEGMSGPVAPPPGEEPTYSFDANVIRLFFSVWY